MPNFVIRPDGDYRFRNKSEGEVVSIQVEYDKGGASVFSYGERSRPRGISVTGRFSEIGDGFERFTIGGGRKGFSVFVESAARKNAKRLQYFAAKLDEHAPALAELLDKEGPQAAIARVKELCIEQAQLQEVK